jgi:hypothetical protein
MYRNIRARYSIVMSRRPKIRPSLYTDLHDLRHLAGADTRSPNPLPHGPGGILPPPHRRWTACLALGGIRALGGPESSKLSCQHAARGWRLKLARAHDAGPAIDGCTPQRRSPLRGRSGSVPSTSSPAWCRMATKINSLDSGSTAKELHSTRSTPMTIQRQSAARGIHTAAMVLRGSMNDGIFVEPPHLCQRPVKH